jgi:hypothetical protein
MIMIYQWQGERAGQNTGKIDRDKPESSTSYGIDDLGAERIGHRSHEILRRQLDPCDLIVVTYSQVSDSQLPQGGLGAFDLAQLGRCHGMVMGDPRRQARSSRFVGYLQVQASRNRTHRTFRHAGLSEWSQHVVVSGCTSSGSVGSQRVIGVFPVCDGIELIPVGDHLLDPAEQLVLAIETSVDAVRLVLGAVILVGFHFDDRYAHLASDIMRRNAFRGRKTWGHSKQPDNPIRA